MNTIEPVPWRGVRASDKLILLILLLSATAVLALSFLNPGLVRRLAGLIGARPATAWLLDGYNAWIAAAGLFLLAGVYLLWVRQRMVSDKRLWYGTGCPNCMERELVRVTRQTRDRLYMLGGIPAYRYACRNCTWRGLRVARREHSPERELELEAALLRFQPDGLIAAIPAGREYIDEATSSSAPTTPQTGAIFRDAGDVSWMEDPALAAQIDDDPQAVEQGNNHAEPGSLDGMEWLWRRSSDI